MDAELIIFALLVTLTITVLYKVLPHRKLGEKKPFISFFPKYRVDLDVDLLPSNAKDEIEEALSKCGFVKNKCSGSTCKYSRGHLLGDISVKIAKVNMIVTIIDNQKPTIAIEAGWVVAFDTGDFWQFLHEVKGMIEKQA